ncbi:hypothetical protein Pyn_03853 [Prunus yedoensis var. nudiflora]|uniref:Uncharacterized protein n=1 Tax=Prunus yedoensis var. nudiflora TaxID=2094558 RepID=A0A314USL4_PRUYE|nr:hypothetical protein Pyn_03853 [Prunus yedoensis var. nudiflora]
MANNFPTGDDRKPPPNFVVVPVSLIQKDGGRGIVNVCGNAIETTDATDSGISNFSNLTDHTGQGGEGCTAVTRHDLKVIDNKVTAKGGKGSGITNFGNCTLGKNSNDEDDAAAGGSGDQGHKRAPRSSAPAPAGGSEVTGLEKIN